MWAIPFNCSPSMNVKWTARTNRRIVRVDDGSRGRHSIGFARHRTVLRLTAGEAQIHYVSRNLLHVRESHGFRSKLRGVEAVMKGKKGTGGGSLRRDVR